MLDMLAPFLHILCINLTHVSSFAFVYLILCTQMDAKQTLGTLPHQNYSLCQGNNSMPLQRKFSVVSTCKPWKLSIYYQ